MITIFQQWYNELHKFKNFVLAADWIMNTYENQNI